MSRRYATVDLPDSRWPGFALEGRKTPDEMIAYLRDYAAREAERWQNVLDTPDEAFQIVTAEGVHVRRKVEILQPGRNV